jgi:hypothetical protein
MNGISKSYETVLENAYHVPLLILLIPSIHNYSSLLRTVNRRIIIENRKELTESHNYQSAKL